MIPSRTRKPKKAVGRALNFEALELRQMLSASEPPPALQVYAGHNAVVDEGAWLQLSGDVLGDWGDMGMPAAWSQLSGPSNAIFTNPADTNSLVQFNQDGIYELQLIGQSNGMVVHGLLDVTVNDVADFQIFRDTTVADFEQGTPDANLQTTQAANGELALSSNGVSYDLNGSSLPADWTTISWNTGSSVTPGGGMLALDGAAAGTSQLFAPGRTLEFVATFTDNNLQHGGFGVTYSGESEALFSTLYGGGLYARVKGASDTLIAGDWLGAPHLYRIDWQPSSIVFSIDGTQVASYAVDISDSMRPLFSDYYTGGEALAVDAVSMPGYAASGTYLSRVFNAGQTVDWDSATWTSQQPVGTDLSISVRTGSTPLPDATWTDFTTVDSPGATIGRSGQYAQYQAILTSSDSGSTPVLQDITLRYRVTGPDTSAPVIISRLPGAGAAAAPQDGPVSVTFSETMNPATITSSTFRLRASGDSEYVPATVSYAGTTAILQPSGPLSPSTTYEVSVLGTVADLAGNLLGATDTWTFNTVAADTTPPTVTNRVPSAGATGVTPNAAVNVTFSETMNAASITTSTIRLRALGASTDVSATVSYADTTATLQPSSPLSPSTTYQVTVAASVTDLAGNPLGTPSTWSFTTVVDTAPPTVTNRVPSAGATGVALNTAVNVTFSETMNAASITNSTLRLRAAGASTDVPATITYTGTTATLRPNNPLSESTTYQVTLEGTVTDLAGNELGSATMWSFTTQAALGVALPELPRVQVDTTYSLPTGGQTWIVNAGDNLQTILDAAQPGDVVQLEAGATFQGNFIVRPKIGDGWIYVVSSSLSQLPSSGTRVSAADAVNMPKLIAPDYSNPAIVVQQGVSKIRFVGIDITTTHTNTNVMQYGLVRVGIGGSGQAAADNIHFDRCFVHGTPTGGVRDGFVTYRATNFALIDSYLKDFHTVTDESHGIQIYTSQGPTKIANNYIEVAGINVFVGDNGVDNIPADLEIVGNHLFKPLSYKQDDPSYAGTPWRVKNLIEFKAATRALIEGNLLENVWAEVQDGNAFVFTPRGGIVSDMTIRNNVVRKFVHGMMLNSADVILERVLIENNLFYDAFDVPTSQYAFRMAGGPGKANDFTIRHNTFMPNTQVSGFINFYGSSPGEITRLAVHDNLFTHGSYGVIGNNRAQDCPRYPSTCQITTSITMSWLMRLASLYQPQANWDNWQLPSSVAAVGFTDTTFDEIGDFRLSVTSAYYQAGTDGEDIGVNVDAILAALAAQ